MLSKVEPRYHEEGWRIFSIMSFTSPIYHKNRFYPALRGKNAVFLSFAIEDVEDPAIPVPAQLLSEEETKGRVKWIDTRFRVCCAGLLEIRPNIDDPKFDFPMRSLGNRNIGYIHRTAGDFLATMDAQKTFIGKHRNTAFHIETRLFKAHMIYLKSCFEPTLISYDVWRFDLVPTIERTMCLARKIELETNLVRFEVFTELKCIISCFQGSECRWEHFIAEPLANRSVNFVSLAIFFGLNRYLAKVAGPGAKTFMKKEGRPYLDLALQPLREGFSLITWDLETIRFLLECGGNPNQVYKYMARIDPPPHAEVATTPWYAVLEFVRIFYCGPQPPTYHKSWSDESTLELYFRRDGIIRMGSCISSLGSLFELLLNYGADPYVVITDKYGTSSVYDIICQALVDTPEDIPILKALLPDAALKPNESRMLELKSAENNQTSEDLQGPGDPDPEEIPLTRLKKKQKFWKRRCWHMRVRKLVQGGRVPATEDSEGRELEIN